MKKKIITSFILLINLFTMSVFADEADEYDYKNGLLDNTEIIENHNLKREMYDNNLDTRFYLKDDNRSKYYIEFNQEIDLESVYLKAWTGHTAARFTFIFNDNTEIVEEISGGNMREGYFDMTYSNVVRIDIDFISTNTRVYEIDFFGEISEVKPPNDVEKLTENHTENTITLNWENPLDHDFSHVEIYQDNELIKDNFTNESITIPNLEPATTYTFKIITVNDKGNKSSGKTIIVTTDDIREVEIHEVQNLQAEPDHGRVDLSWENPEYEGFHHVRIYRKVNSNDRNPFMNLLFGSIVNAADGFDPIFETNGTYFKDLTVEPDTTYEYKLTTESTDGVESAGVTITATTPQEPAPEMGGVTDEKDENGDFVFKWTSPTGGEVKIIVGGEEYATVPANDGSITIPKDEMAYTTLGSPDVRLVPISESGKEGSAVNPTDPDNIGGAKLPLTAKDTLTAATQLFMIVGPFLLLILAIYITNVHLIPIIKKAVANRTNRNTAQGSRRERA